jgi:hypothetical protein
VTAALVAVVALAGLLAAGRWLQPQLDGQSQAPATTRPASTAPTPTSPAPTSPTLATDQPTGSSPISRVVATSSPVDAIAVTRQAVWLAVDGLVLRVAPATGRAQVVPGVEDSAAPVVDLAAGAGAVWAVTSAAGLLRIDPRTARLTASLPGPVSAIATGGGGVWAVCCQGRVRRRRPSVFLPVRWPWGPARAQCGSVAPGAGCGGWTRRTAGRPGPSGWQPSRAAPSWAGSWWSPVS